jgi:hypothetical protein
MPGTDEPKRCAADDCTAILSRFNEGDYCGVHEGQYAWEREIRTYKLHERQQNRRKWRVKKARSAAEAADAHAFLEALRG